MKVVVSSFKKVYQIDWVCAGTACLTGWPSIIINRTPWKVQLITWGRWYTSIVRGPHTQLLNTLIDSFQNTPLPYVMLLKMFIVRRLDQPTSAGPVLLVQLLLFLLLLFLLEHSFYWSDLWLCSDGWLCAPIDEWGSEWFVDFDGKVVAWMIANFVMKKLFFFVSVFWLVFSVVVVFVYNKKSCHLTFFGNWIFERHIVSNALWNFRQTTSSS